MPEQPLLPFNHEGDEAAGRCVRVPASKYPAFAAKDTRESGAAFVGWVAHSSLMSARRLR